ncbi:MAG: pitrilysin family protein [Minisyncoccia bacterium]
MTKQMCGAQLYSLSSGGKLLTAQTSVRDVVVIEGSILGGSNHLAKNLDTIPSLLAGLLDAGTKKKSKEVIREALADRGISLSFSAGGDRTYFSGHCLPEDLSFLLSTIVECLSEAHFPLSEVKTIKTRTLGNLAEMKTDTGTQASIALTRALYDTDHLNFSRTLDEREKGVRDTDRSDLTTFKKMLGRNGLVLAVAGDIHPVVVQKAVEKAFANLHSTGVLAIEKRANKKVAVAIEKIIPIPDKANIDVLLGASLPLHTLDPLYHSAFLLTEMLGGGFASHLMQTIRERDGLTYGVYAGLRGFGDGTDGYMRISATFSPEKYKQSVEALRREIGIFFSTGLTENALQKKKDEISGSYLVGLSTTQGLARTLHQLTIDGRALSYLDQRLDLIRAVSLADLHTVADFVHLDKLSLVASGTFPKK